MKPEQNAAGPGAGGSRAMALARIASRVVKASALVREPRVASGVPELDRVLGPAGLARGSLVDLHAGEGARAIELALSIAARLEPARALVLVDTTGDFYPPAAAQAGVELDRLIIIKLFSICPRESPEQSAERRIGKARSS